MKKKIKNFIIALAFLGLGAPTVFQSCNYLDIDPYITDLFTLDSVFVRKEYTQKYLTYLYSYLIDNGSNVHYEYTMPYNFITDEGSLGYKTNAYPYNYFLNNEMTPEKLGSFDRWNTFYRGIRKANYFLENVNKCQEVSEQQRSEWRGEAMFVKASTYFELMLAWGPVPIMPEHPVDFDIPISEMMVERNTWDECSDYVTSLLETAIQLLPYQVRDDSETGRATKYSAMAVLSRLSLYTASPLYNGENKEFSNFHNKAGTPYLNPNFDMEKWAVAAAKSKRLVDMKPNDLYTVGKLDNTPTFPVPAEEQANFPNGVGGIDPYHSYADMFNGENVLASTNTEVLFSRQIVDRNMDKWAAPHVVSGWGSFFVPQRLVDAYRMIDGRTIADASDDYPYEYGYTDNEIVFSGLKSSNGVTIPSGTHKWYVNREMRFYATIGFNNSYYASVSTPPDKINPVDGKVANFYYDGQSGKYNAQTVYVGGSDYPMTGYLCRKFYHYESSWLTGGRLKHRWHPTYRMAEVYLNYVEAMNELDKSYTIDGETVSRDMNEMKRCFNLIRYRAGLPGITDADVANVERMRDLILQERQVEMAWENRRYHDLRRTKKAVIYENSPVLGCNIDARKSEPDMFHTVVRVREKEFLYRVFTNRQTFFPIPKHEIDKNYNLDQFPGY